MFSSSVSFLLLVQTTNWLVEPAFVFRQHERVFGRTLQGLHRNDYTEESTSIIGAEDDNSAGEMDHDDVQDRHIPMTGISVSDEMDTAQVDHQFVTEVVPVQGGLRGVAQLVTNPSVQHSFEPVRYLVALSPPPSLFWAEQSNAQTAQNDDHEFANATFVMVDVPPYSPALVTKLKTYMGINHTLKAILITSSDAIHNDEAPEEMYSLTRRADLLTEWQQAFPEAAIVSNRLDTPRDCRNVVTQRLDGNGPFGWDENGDDDDNLLFVEMGRPLRYEEWDHQTAKSVMDGTQCPEDVGTASEEEVDDEHEFSSAAIRAREQGRKVLAVCTPGHSFGSLSYVFPEMGVCCSGYTIPVEDNRAEENEGYGGAGPALDVRGYITTSRAGITRQMESARLLVERYVDRFATVLPSRGDPLMLDERSQPEERREVLEGIIDQYDRIGQIYEQLGITASGDDLDDLSP